MSYSSIKDLNISYIASVWVAIELDSIGVEVGGTEVCCAFSALAVFDRGSLRVC